MRFPICLAERSFTVTIRHFAAWRPINRQRASEWAVRAGDERRLPTLTRADKIESNEPVMSPQTAVDQRGDPLFQLLRRDCHQSSNNSVARCSWEEEEEAERIPVRDFRPADVLLTQSQSAANGADVRTANISPN